MRRYSVTIICAMFFELFAYAQDLTDTEVLATMNKAFMLNNEKNTRRRWKNFCW